MALIALVIICSTFVGLSRAEPALRYTTESCDNMAPVYKDENFNNLDLGPEVEKEKKEDDKDGDQKEVFNTPKKSNTRNPPFELDFDFKQYRRKREYQIILSAYEHFDSFMLQVQGRSKDGNITRVGKWMDIPGIAVGLRCGKARLGAVVDKGRPVKLGNMTFLWEAPAGDEGPIQIKASVAYKDQYVMIESPELEYSKFPLSVKGCGSKTSCFRLCTNGPRCEADETEYMITMERPDDSDRMLFRMGGTLHDRMSYFAVAFGKDYYHLKNADMVTCRRVRKGSANEAVMLEHFLLENANSKPYHHRDNIRLESSGFDRDTNFTWCQFYRPIRAEGVYELDLTEKMHHFYLWGKLDNDSLPVIPGGEDIKKSYVRYNVSQVYNDVDYDAGRFLGGGGQASVYLGSKENMLFSGFVALVSAMMARSSLES